MPSHRVRRTGRQGSPQLLFPVCLHTVCTHPQSSAFGPDSGMFIRVSKLSGCPSHHSELSTSSTPFPTPQGRRSPAAPEGGHSWLRTVDSQTSCILIRRERRAGLHAEDDGCGGYAYLSLGGLQSGASSLQRFTLHSPLCPSSTVVFPPAATALI